MKVTGTVPVCILGICCLLLSEHAWGITIDRVLSASPVPGGFMVDLQMRHGHMRKRGRMLQRRSGSLDIEGSVRDIGYFYVTLGLGTPRRNFSVIIDTGSTITYVPCKGCKHCGKHKDEPFDVKASTSAVELKCNSPLCNCGSPSCMCENNKCYYSRSYAEQSSSAGYLIEDRLAFPDSKGPVKLVFGCEDDETGEIFRQMADGIMGMGNNNNAFQSQLVNQKVIDDTFGLCFGYPDGGKMLLGDVKLVDADKMQYTALHPGQQVHYYTTILQHIYCNDADIGVPSSEYAIGYGAVVDSGTTFTYLPSSAFKKFAKAVGDYAKSHGLESTPGADSQYNDICWKGGASVAAGLMEDIHKLDAFFPKMEFVFEPSVKIRMRPAQYLFRMGSGSYCLGIFDNGSAGTLIGGISVRDVLVQYDRRNNRVGFLETDGCGKIKIEATSTNQKTAKGPPSSAVLPPPLDPSRGNDVPLSLPPGGGNMNPSEDDQEEGDGGSGDGWGNGTDYSSSPLDYEAEIHEAEEAGKRSLAPWIAAVLIVGFVLGAAQLGYMYRVKIAAFIRNFRWSNASYQALPVSGAPLEMVAK